MTPTHGNDSPGDDSQEHCPIDPPTIPIPPRRLPRTPRLRTLRLALRHPRPARPSTVWPCAQDDRLKDTGQLANWLLTAVIKIVTTYTQPGQRVLLLDPAPLLTPPASWPATAVQNRARRDPYAGLHEAAWTVVRLGRSVQTHTVAAHPDTVDEHPVDASAESESGPGLRTDGPTTDQPAGPSPHHHPGPGPTETAFGPGCYDLIITAAEPSARHWFRPTDWTGLLTPTGTLTVITHSDHTRSRLADPAGSLVRAAHHVGLHYLDRIALLHVPIRDGVLTAATPTAHVGSRPSSGRSTTPVRHAQAHEDLLVFTRQPATSGTADNEETSDD
jgi:hypothetical protein